MPILMLNLIVCEFYDYVLGAPKNLQRLGPGANLNDYTSPGIFYFDIGERTGISNVPEGFYFGTVVSLTASNQTIQYAAEISGAFWFRTADNTVFTNWLRCDNFGCNSLSALATALGGLVYRTIPCTAGVAKEEQLPFGLYLISDDIGRGSSACYIYVCNNESGFLVTPQSVWNGSPYEITFPTANTVSFKTNSNMSFYLFRAVI